MDKIFQGLFAMKKLVLILCVFSTTALAYEPGTHEVLSSEALKASVLADSSLNILVGLGIDSELFNRNVQKFPAADNDNKSIEGLIKYGSNFEDDEATSRSLNHFFDPANSRPLTVFGAQLGVTSPDWALEDNGDVSPILTGPQQYSYKDGMGYFDKALTSQTKTGRDSNWGLLFQSLGQIIHHIQDMSQPQHVRNDAHCDKPILCRVLGQYDPSWHEEYSFKKFENGIPGSIPLNYTPPQFPTAREYWTTSDNKGIADFTNRNFVSKDSIFNIDGGVFVANAEYTLPVPNSVPVTISLSDSSLLGVSGQALCDQLKQSNPAIIFPASVCDIDFVSTTVNDSFTGVTSTNNRAVTYSIFDKKLTDYGKKVNVNYWSGSGGTVDRLFTLNQFNFDAAHNYLIPRAVAYSAGLINHFFRGKIDMIPDPGSSGWLIQNLSSDEDMEGTFTLYYDYIDPADSIEKRAPVPGAVWTTSGPVVPGGQMVVSAYTTPAGLVRKTLVFQGRMGAENNVVTGKQTGGWSVPRLISTNQQNMTKPRIAIDQSGNIIVVWRQLNINETNILASRFDALTGLWDLAPTKVDIGVTNKSWYVSTKLLDVSIASNTGRVIWREIAPNFTSYLLWENQLQMTSNVWGTAFHNPSAPDIDNPPPTTAWNANGDIVRLIEASNDLNAQHYNQVSGSWDNSLSIESLPGSSYDSTIVMENNGNAHAVWIQLSGSNYSIYINHYNK